MVLHAVGRQAAVPHPFDRLIVEIAVRDLQFRGKTALFDREAVILRGDFDSLVVEVQNRLVGAAVAKLELEGRRSAGQREQLVP